MNYAEYTHSLAGPRDGGMMTNAEQDFEEAVERALADTIARHPGDLVKAYLKVVPVVTLDADIMDAVDARLAMLMNDAERGLLTIMGFEYLVPVAEARIEWATRAPRRVVARMAA